MSIIRTSSFLLALFAVTAAKSESPVQSIPAAFRLPASAFSRGAPFLLRGTVLSVFGNKFALETCDGKVELTPDGPITNLLVAAGDHVTVAGHLFLSSIHMKRLAATNIVITGKSPPRQPLDVHVRDFFHHDLDYLPVRVSGVITDTFPDEVDPRYQFLTLGADGKSIPLCLKVNDRTQELIGRLLNAKVRITGICKPNNNDGWRVYQGRLLSAGTRGIEILEPAPEDPFSAEPLDIAANIDPDEIAQTGQRSVRGKVIAVWHGDRFLLATRQQDNNIIQSVLARGTRPPACGAYVTAVGYPATDLFHITLNNAIWRSEDKPLPVPADPKPEFVTARQLLLDNHGRPQFQAPYHGHLVTIRGVARSIPTTDPVEGKLHLEDGGYDVPVDFSPIPDALDSLSIGCTLQITGICLMEVDTWKPTAPFPRVKGFVIIPRTPDDIRVISRPPWWTPGRLLVVIGSLLAALLGIIIWNRILNRLVERRSRELLREQAGRVGDRLKVGERTRLAVELHDSLSQTLTGVSFQIDAAEQARQKDPSQIKRYLDVARQTLQSCREELRNCLWDLRNNALEEADAEVAIRKTVEPQIGDAELAIDFNVPRQKFTDNTFHAILCIVRELAVNAVRHGQARRITVRGGLTDGRLALSVTDDGCGFDPDRRPGAEEGHFGLLGVAERVETLGGTLDIKSSPVNGTTVSIVISP